MSARDLDGERRDRHQIQKPIVVATARAKPAPALGAVDCCAAPGPRSFETGQRERGHNQRHVAEGLGEVPELSTADRVVFLREEPDIVSQ